MRLQKGQLRGGPEIIRKGKWKWEGKGKGWRCGWGGRCHQEGETRQPREEQTHRLPFKKQIRSHLTMMPHT